LHHAQKRLISCQSDLAVFRHLQRHNSRTVTATPPEHGENKGVAPTTGAVQQATTTGSLCARCNGLDNLGAFAVPFCSCIQNVLLAGTMIPANTFPAQNPVPTNTLPIQTTSVPPTSSDGSRSSLLVHDANVADSGKRHSEVTYQEAASSKLSIQAHQSHANQATASAKLSTHVYQDHADDPLASGYSPTSSGTFPFILHTMLSEVEDIGLSSIVSWQPHGRAFIVHDSDAFVEHVMKLYFNQSQMPSFRRQLNLWGFHRLNTGFDVGAYFHEYFLRDRIDLCVFIRRTKVKGGSSPSIPMREPDFYAMPPVGMSGESSDERMSAGNSEDRTTEDHSTGDFDELLTEEKAPSSPLVLDPIVEGLVPRPLPPLFDQAPVSSVHTPGTAPSTSVMDIGNERWVFHLSSSRIPIQGQESSLQRPSQGVPDGTESNSTTGAFSSGDVLNDTSFNATDSSMASLEVDQGLSDCAPQPLPSITNDNRNDSFSQLIENMLEGGPSEPPK